MDIRLQDIPDSEFDLLHEAVLRILFEYGVLFEPEQARALLKKAGNTENEQGRVLLKPAFVEAMLALVPREGFTLYGREESRKLRVAVDNMSFRPSTGMPFVLDYPSGKRREAELEDVRRLVLITDALPHYDMVNAVVSPSGSPGGRENIQGFIHSHRYSLKPSDLTVSTAREVRAAAGIAAAIRGGKQKLREKPLTAMDIAMISPLRCTEQETEAFLECARHGIPVEILTSPSLGVSSPITIAGGVAVSMAEMIAALCLLYQIQPGLGVINTARVSPINIRTTAYNYGAPELGMGSLVTAACCARYGIPTNLYGFGTEAKLPGMQSAMEKAFSGIVLALGKPHMITGSGILDNALVTSPEMIIIDHEAIRFLKRLKKGVEITEHSIGVDVLIKAMMESGTLLAEEHTLEYMRSGELMECGLGQWCSLSQWEEEGKPDLYARAHGKAQEILATYTVEPFEPSLEKEIQRILDEF